MSNFLLGMARALSHQLGQSPGAKSTQAPVPLALYGDGLPTDIHSSWVFVLRRGMVHPAERHPNSIQRMFALAEAGLFETWSGSGWSQQRLMPGDAGLSIPVQTWHRAPELTRDWAVVSFHTADAERLIEEIGDPETGSVGPSRRYIGEV